MAALDGYYRNVLTMITGTLIAQLIPFVSMPILTRLYDPESFGLYGFVLGVSGLLVVVATGKYEVAIMQPREKRNADVLFRIAVCLGVIFCIISCFVIYAGYYYIESIQHSEIPATHLLAIPAVAGFMVFHNSFTMWLNRSKLYKQISANRILYSFLVAVVPILLAFVFPDSAGLLLGLLAAYFVVITWLIIRFWTEIEPAPFKEIRKLLFEYRDYPKFAMPSGVFNVIASQAPVILFVPVFGALYSGCYLLVERMLMAPIALIGASVSAVYRQAAQIEMQENGKYDAIFLLTFRKLLIIGVPVFFVIGLLSPVAFSIVFGKNWVIAGEFSRILAPFFCARFVVSPLMSSFYVSDRLKLNLVVQFLYCFFILLSIVLGWWSQDIFVTVKLVSLFGSLFYVIVLFAIYRLSLGGAARSSLPER